MREIIFLYARPVMCLPRLVFGLNFFYLISPIKFQIETTIQIKTSFLDTWTNKKTKSLLVQVMDAYFKFAGGFWNSICFSSAKTMDKQILKQVHCQ